MYVYVCLYVCMYVCLYVCMYGPIVTAVTRKEKEKKKFFSCAQRTVYGRTDGMSCPRSARGKVLEIQYSRVRTYDGRIDRRTYAAMRASCNGDGDDSSNRYVQWWWWWWVVVGAVMTMVVVVGAVITFRSSSCYVTTVQPPTVHLPQLSPKKNKIK